MTTVMGSPTRSCWIDLTHPIVVSPYFAIRPLEVDTMVSFITLAPNNFEWRQPITTPAVSENKTPPEVIERGLPASKSETSGAEPQPDSMQAGLDTGLWSLACSRFPCLGLLRRDPGEGFPCQY